MPADLVDLVPRVSGAEVARDAGLGMRAPDQVGAMVELDGTEVPVQLQRRLIPNRGFTWDLICPRCESRRRHLHIRRTQLLCRNCAGLQYICRLGMGTTWMRALKEKRDRQRREEILIGERRGPKSMDDSAGSRRDRAKPV